ncbi:MAG: hypothetical protein KAR76_04845 [Methanosarcinales archaeon]|nr:hypothetical protein [Methanosarcinales archaeon]
MCKLCEGDRESAKWRGGGFYIPEYPHLENTRRHHHSANPVHEFSPPCNTGYLQFQLNE